ncbi:MAG: HlyD family efflux transporter periplasmic adaptor subunit [Betaproteobacteria bacterium]
MSEEALRLAEERCRAAPTVEALAFTIANETFQVVPYRQALVWRQGLAGPDLMAVSGLVSLPEDSPFTVWVRRLVKAFWPSMGDAAQVFDLALLESRQPDVDSRAGFSSQIIDGWREWWPAHLVLVPLVKGSQRLGAAMFLLADPPGQDEMAALSRLQSSWSYCAWALTKGQRSFAQRLPLRIVGWMLAGLVLALLMIPIPQTVLAPAEIVALNAVAVSAPVDGVIKAFHVRPNQAVRAGQLLFSFDDTTLRNRREVAARGLDVAAVESHSAQQKAFDDSKARGEVATLQGRIAERRAELRAVEEQLKRIDVLAPRDGIAVFGDVNDWQGRPVVTGERVMQLADPKEAGVMVFLSVADAISLEEGARIRVFLNVAPLSPLEARLSETSYLAILSPDGIASYRLRAKFIAPDEDTSRIGLKGTAKLYGETVLLGYYLLRRPLAAARQWSGF